jgi:hypothetical protein
MDTDNNNAPEKIAGYLHTCANQLVEVELSSGKVLTGIASPYSIDADHFRLNAEDGSFSDFIVWAHVARIRRLGKKGMPVPPTR